MLRKYGALCTAHWRIRVELRLKAGIYSPKEKGEECKVHPTSHQSTRTKEEGEDMEEKPAGLR